MRISDWSSDVCSSDLTQIWPLASGLAGFSVGSSEIATVRRGWPSFVNPWIFLPLLSVLGLPMGRYPAAARLSTTLPQLDSALPSRNSRTSRSEERRVGKECVSKCSSRWSPYHYKKTQAQI